MSRNKRKSGDISSSATIPKPTITVDHEAKRLKVESSNSNFLHLDDSLFIETDYQAAFHSIADKLINSYELVINEEHLFRVSEIEFYFYHSIRHPDTFAH